MARKPSDFENHPMTFPLRPEYRAFCRHVVDGDTFDVLVDLGLQQYAYVTVRLYGIDTWELFGSASLEEREKGRLAREHLATLILNKPVRLVTHKDTQTLSRYVAETYLWSGLQWLNVTALMREAGHEKV